MLFRTGDAVEIVSGGALPLPDPAWRGLRGTVVPPDGFHVGWVHVEPATDRPDNYGRTPFYWHADGLRHV